MRKILYTLPLFILVFYSNIFAQNDCPSLPSRAKFDTLGYISANIPNNPNNPPGKLYLGQGWVQRGSVLRPGFFPTNKPSWAIATAVAWNLARNLNQRVEYPNINYWMATLIQETELRCATGLTWSDPSHVPDTYNPTTVYAAQINNGCLQIEGPGSAWSALQQAYPNGRIPFDNTLYDQLIEGVDGYESSALVKTYYDAYTSQIFNYNVGWDFYNNVDCKRKHDPYAYEKMSASNYNAGPNGFMNNAGIINNTGPGCWSGLAATTAGYGNDIARWISVLDGNTSYCDYPNPVGGSAKGPDYNAPVPYSEVTKYLNIIKPMYADINFNTEVIPYVEAAFIKKAGSLSGTINFSDFGDVIDAIVLHLPMDKPTPVDGSPIGINLGCSGKFLPYGHVDIINGNTNMCLGKSVTLELAVDAGNAPNLQFKWFKGDPVNGTLIGTDKMITITPTQVGTQVYSGQICNSNGCYTVYSNTQNSCQDSRNLNGFNIITRDCNLCPFVASGTSVNTICKGTADGSITLNLVNAPANYRVSYKVTTPIGTDTVSFVSSGNTVKLNKIRDGIYNFTLTDLSDPTCQAYTSVKVGYNTDINEYIDAQITGIANCVADLKAEIKEFPAPCLWKVAVYSTPTFQWEPAVNAIVKTSTGKTALQKLTAKYPAPNAYDQWTAAEASEFYLSLNSGETISMGTALTTTPGATQWYNYRFEIYDEANNKVYTGNSPAQSAKFGYNHMIGDYTVTCPQTVPNYSISWTPSLQNLNTQPKISTGKADVKGSNQTFYVSAVNNNNPQCILTDSVVLVGDPTCSSTCKFPGVAAWRGGNTLITDTLRICKDSIVNIRLTGADAGTFRYQLLKDGVAQTPTNTTGIFTVNSTGRYQVRVSDNADPNNTDCQVLSNNLFVRILPSVKPTAKFVVNNSICAGDSSLLRINFTGTAPYAFQLTTPNGIVKNNNITQNFTTIWVKNQGKFRLDSIKDATFGNCGGFDIKTDSVNLIVNPIPTFDLGKDTSICASRFPFALNGPTGMNTYTWTGTGTPTGANFSASAAGKVVLNVVKDGCSFKDSLTITTKPALVVNLGKDSTRCDGSVVLDAGAGFNSYIWNANPANNQRTFTATTTGQYRVAVANTDGCVGFDTINVTINTSPTVNIGDTAFRCNNSPAHTFNATTANATYRWNNNTTNPTLSATTQGDYWVDVTVNGCTTRDSAFLAVATQVLVDLGADTARCNGSVVLDASAGYSTYRWNGNAANNQRTFTATSTGVYRVDVTTADGCVGFDEITVTINTSPTVNIGDTATICPTSPAYVFNATRPNATYVWNDGSTNATLSTTTQGDYWVDVTVNGCTTRDSAYLLVSNTLNVNIGGNQTVCPGVEAEFTTNFTGATYNWNNGASTQSTFKTSTAGPVTVTVTDAGGCQGTATAQVIVNNPLTINLGNDIAFCIGDSATLALNPTRNGLNYNWNTGATTPTLKVKTAGTYTLDVDSAGCTAQSSVDVVVNNLPVVNLGADTFVCAGVNTVLTLDAGAGMQSYQWGGDITGASRTVNVTSVGTFHVRIVDANNCVNRDTIVVTERVATPISLMDAPKQVTICPGGNHIATVPSALQNVANTSWIWNDGSNGITNEVSNRVDGENVGVSIQFTNQFGCVSKDSITVRVRNTLPINMQSQSICAGENVTFNSGYSGNNFTFVWNNDVANNQATFSINNATVAQSGNITVQITSNEGCSGDTTVSLTVNALPQPILSNDTLCAGQNIVLSTGVTGSHVWSDGSTSNTLSITNATPNQSGIYSVTVTNAQNCSKDTSMRLMVYANPDFEIVSPAAACEGTTVTLSTTAPSNTHTVLWNGGSLGNTFNANTSGTYTALVTHTLSGCKATKNTILNFLATPTVILPQDTTLCEGVTWNLRALNNSDLSTYNLNWSTGASGNSITIRINGLYWLEAKNGNCASRDSIWVDYSALPISDLVADTTICFDDAPEIILNPGRYGGQSYLWNDGSTDLVYVAKEKGRYSVEITNEFGCKIISGTEIFEDCPFAVWIPNGFTPNEDGKNDKLTIMGRGIDEVQMYIFNRWGQLIWTGNAIGDGWDGKINGNLVQQDVYVYKVDFKYTDSGNVVRSKSRTGTVVVYR